MHFELSDERRMLGETLERFIRDEYPLETRQAAAGMDHGYDPAMWAKFAELGAIGALVPEAKGGFGGEGEDVMVAFEAFGRGLVVEPFLATLMATTALGADHADLIEAAGAGRTRLAFAHAEPDNRYDLTRVATRAEDGKLTGHKTVVLNGGDAERIVVSARASGDEADEAGIGLYLIDPSDPGVARRPYGTIEGGHACELALEGTEGTPLTGAEDGYPTLEAAMGRGVLALSAEAVGAMDVAKDITLDYLKTRKQFGAPLGKFQALQHRMVEMALEIEQARSAVILAAGRMEQARGERERNLSAAKHLIGRVGRLVSEESIQLHGGVAMTWEYPLPHYAKRLTMIDHILGDEDFHLARFMAFAA